MTEGSTVGGFEIHAEARGRHWVAWLTRGKDDKPLRSVLLVGQTRKEAEARARQWAKENATR